MIDDLSTGTIDNIQHLKSNPRFHYTIDSVHNQPVTAELVDQSDIVIHLAAAVGVKLIVESPVRTIETNVRGTEVVLALANKKQKRVLIASTSEVYGLSTDVPFREDGNLVMGATTKGRWSYACSKAIDEFLALAYWREKKLPTTIVRLFNTVGPRQTGRYGMVIPDLRQASARGSSHHGLWQRQTDALFWICWRRGGRIDQADGPLPTRSGRFSTSARLKKSQSSSSRRRLRS